MANGKVKSVFYAAESGGGASSLTPILMIVLLFGVMYFMMIRPQQKRRRETEQMQASIGPGDEVVTVAGLHATIVSLTDDTALLEVAPGVQVRYARQAIGRVLTSAQRPAESTVAGETDAKQ